MFSSRTLFTVIFTVFTAVDAGLVNRNTGKASLSLITRLNERGSLSIVERDHARMQAMIQAGSHPTKRATPEQVSITNSLFIPSIEIEVGHPATNYKLIVDTGSANTWIGGNQTYTPTETSKDTGDHFFVRYGSGNATGEAWKDTIAFSASLVISEQVIGVASSSYGFRPFDGILGIGPVDLTNGTVTGMDTVPTVVDNLLSQEKIKEEVFGIFLVPGADTTKEGAITFGGHDDTVIDGPMTYVPLSSAPRPSRYWGIRQSIRYGSEVIMESGDGIVDTGTALTYIPKDAFELYKNKTGAVHDNTTTLYKITPEQYSNLQPLVFIIGDVEYELTANAQIWPRSLNHVLKGSPDALYLVLRPMNQPGIDFISGYTFLERFYTVYDTSNKRMGFAKTKYTYADVN